MKKLLLLTVLFYSLSIINLSAQQWGDYTLIATSGMGAGGGTTALLIDTNSTIVHTWTFPSTAATGYSNYLTKGGILYRTYKVTNSAFSAGGSTGGFQKVDWNGNVLWDYKVSNATHQMHHDIEVMPNGNVLLIAWEVKTSAQLSAAGNITPHLSNPDKIMEIEQTGATTGNVVWEWHAFDHICQNADNTKPGYVTSISANPHLLNINYKNGTNNKDWLHLNGLDYNVALNQIIVSSHNLNEFYVIDKSTTTAEAASNSGGASGKGGDFLFRWGNPAAYAVTSQAANFNVIHDAHWVPVGCPRAGYMVGFNNAGVSSTTSAFDIINPPLVGSAYTQPATGSPFAPATYDKRFTCNGASSNMSNSQQLPNGNQLYCLAVPSGRVYEIDSNGVSLWSYTATSSLPQATRYSACEISNAPAATATITNSGGVLTATSNVSYQWYENGVAIPGATAQSYTTTFPSTKYYQVITKDSFLCASKISDPYYQYPTSVASTTLEKVTVSPNPFINQIEISGDAIKDMPYEIIVYNLSGQTIFSSKNNKIINLSKLPLGQFVLKIKLANGASHQQIISHIQ
jgi:hypothetical protein